MKPKFILSRRKREEKPSEKPSFDVAYENLAVPEVHTGALKDEEAPALDSGHPDGYTVDYENLTIPEIHPGKRKPKREPGR